MPVFTISGRVEIRILKLSKYARKFVFFGKEGGDFVGKRLETSVRVF